MNKITTANDLTQARLNALFDLKEWQKLLIHFDLAPDRFAFIPVIVPDSSWAELCEKALADFLQTAEKKKLQVISLKKTEQLKNLANKLFNLKPNKNLGAIWITAPIPFKKEELEEWQAAWREGMARFNQYRNPFREKFDVPVLLVGAEWIKEITRNMAPDLWSVLTILVKINPPTKILGSAIISGSTEITAIGNIQTPAENRGIDPSFALQEAERLRGKKGQEIGLARLLYRAAVGFDARAIYREALQSSTEAAEIIEKLFNRSIEKDKNEIESFYADILNTKGNALDSLGRLNEAIAEFDKAIEIYEELVKAGRSELSNNLAIAYMNKGSSLDSLGRLNEAIAEFDKAIEIYEELVKAGRSELSNNLATVYMNKGVTLRHLGRLSEAIAEFNKAIEIYEELVKAGRSELLNDSATAYMNKGNALANLGRLNEAIEEYDKAIEIREELVKAGRSELLNDLAIAYMNKGSSLDSLGRLNEAIAEFNKAIEIYEELVKAGRSELSNNLAIAYMNKGVALDDFGKSNEAIEIYGQAISLWEDSLQRGELQNLPNLIKAFRNRVEVLIKIEDWESIADDIVKAFEEYKKYIKGFDLSDFFKDQIKEDQNAIKKYVCEISPENREEIYKNAGEMGDIFRQYVEDFGENQQDSTKQILNLENIKFGLRSDRKNKTMF